tara:strand:- start:62 stop:463 length:402 start_codon:yes stop_codon:yes gene_type:complete
MIEILKSTLDLAWGLLSGIWQLIAVLLTWIGEVLYHLHLDAPRLEGLLIGVALAWVLLRRDKHPILRVLSSPLKLVVDVLDLAWDQLIEIVIDVKEVIFGWVNKSWGFVSSKIKLVYEKLLAFLRGIKEKLSK